MLTRRTIELQPGATGLPQVLISSQNLIDCGLANEVLAQCPPLNATLRCHPQMLAPVRQWLSTRPDTAWQLQADERLDPFALVLVTAQHDLRIDWATTLKALLIPMTTDGTDPAGATTEW